MSRVVKISVQFSNGLPIHGKGKHLADFLAETLPESQEIHRARGEVTYGKPYVCNASGWLRPTISQ